MVIFSYARELGMTVSRLKREMTIDEFYQWQKYYKQLNEKEKKPNLAKGQDVFNMFNSVAKDM